MRHSPQAYLQRMRASAVYNVAINSPLDYAPLLSERLRNRIYLKREDLQPVFSFKLRGAYAAMARLTAEDLDRGVIAASAGNHAQGVALSAQQLGCHATIVVPTTTPEVKQHAILALGAELILHGDSYDDAYEFAKTLGEQTGKTFVHPYDHPDVIAGQGTIGLELDGQLPHDTEAVFIAIGGGGLISGVALALKQLRPSIKIIGVEPEDSDAMSQSVRKGERVRLEKVGLFADGVAVKLVGEETFSIVKQFVDEIIVVSNDSICAALKEVFEDRRAVLEPAGALAIAGMRAYIEREGRSGGAFAAIACGANINFDRLRHIAERSSLGEHSEAIFAVKIPERPGSFLRLCQVIKDRNITEFNYRLGDSSQATIFVGIQIRGQEDVADILDALLQEGFESIDLSRNEIAKTHTRHLVGGRALHVSDERLFHFDFPERKGALSLFLSQLGGHWNISLFHYRNHGSDRGRVLAGIQVPEDTETAFENFLASLGYDYTEETSNPALTLFL